MQEGPKQILRPRVPMPADPLGPRLDPARQSRHKRQPIAAPEKKGAPWGMLVMGAAGALFCCYAFNAGGAKDTMDQWFDGLTASAHGHDGAVAAMYVEALPYVGLALAITVGYVLLKMVLPKKKKPKARALQEQMTVHEFAELMTTRGIGAKVAREAYRMLMTDYYETMRSTVDKSFMELGVSRETVAGMFEELVEKSGGVIRGTLPGLTTVMEMLVAVEETVERAALERRKRIQGVVLEERHRLVVPGR